MAIRFVVQDTVTGKKSLSVGTGGDIGDIPASEIIAANSFVNYWLDAGVWKMRIANATDFAHRAMAFCATGAAAIGDKPTAIWDGPITISTLTGKTGPMFLQVAGGVDATPPTASNNIVQCCGQMIGDGEILLDFDEAIEIG